MRGSCGSGRPEGAGHSSGLLFHIKRVIVKMYQNSRQKEEGLGLDMQADALHGFHIDAQAFYDAIVCSTEDYIYIVDMESNVALVSENMWQEFELPGRLVPELVPVWGELVHEKDKKHYFDSIDDMLRGLTDRHNVEYQVRNRKNEYIWVVCRGLLKRDEAGNPTMFAGVVTPIGSKGKIDSTTGLFTQAECKKRIEGLLERGNTAGGILLLGIDDFKRINDLKNHIFGDSVLRQIAQDIQRMLPPKAEIFRYDGDEFAIAYPGAGADELQELYQAIHLYANREHELDGITYFCSISGGIAVIGRDASDYLDLVKCAASALDASKKKGKNLCTTFSPDLLQARLRKLELTNLLQRSVMGGMKDFSLVYQPFVSAGGLQLKGAEALLRWSCEPYGAVAPVEFVPLLESSGLIVPAGKWVLEQALATCKRWLPHCPDFVMNVNVSYLQFVDRDFLPLIEALLKKYELGAEHVVLELTESYFVTDMPALREDFRRLRELGVRIAMDDFGTGYSSLGLLSQSPADIVKVDRVFISAINDQKHMFNRSFIGAVIQLCHSVGIDVCVEGVEMDGELMAVRSLEADSIQGFYISRPIPPEQFEARFWGSGI